jgi:phosphoribosylanthranilate isomerase
MFRVKICGITSVDDARMAADAGADAIGLNFYQGSPRFCPLDEAAAIAAAVPASVCKVGVFVNATSHEIRQAAATVGLELIQLHGDEPPELLREIRPLPVMRAFRMGDALPAIDDYLRACHRLMCVPRMLLVDAAQQGQYGGTGKTLDWQSLDKNRAAFCGMPLVLAGGLNPANVAAAIAAVRPWGVDVASGVESSPGKKSKELTREFVVAAKAALARAAVQK